LRSLVWLVAAGFTVQAVLTSAMSVHLLTLLQSHGLDPAAAVAVGALVGPSQVGGRILELAFGRRLHPVWTSVVASLLVTLGLAALLAPALSLVPIAVLLYGAGNGIRTIVRGTLPLLLFGASGYAALVGRLALPTLLAQAAAPPLMAVAIETVGSAVSLGMLAALALLGLALAWGLIPATRRMEMVR
jgi:hypothetical protein